MDVRSGVSISHQGASAGHFAALILNRIRVSFSILTQLRARISLALGLTRWSPSSRAWFESEQVYLGTVFFFAILGPSSGPQQNELHICPP